MSTTTEASPILTVNAGRRASARMLEHVARANEAIAQANAAPLTEAQADRLRGYRDELAYLVNVANNTRRAGGLADCIVSRAAADIGDELRSAQP